MSDLPGAVAAILAATPRRYDGTVITEYATPWCGYDACIEHNDQDGPAEPVAARQAAAVARAFADDAQHAEELDLIGGIVARWLRNRADEIEEANRGQ